MLQSQRGGAGGAEDRGGAAGAAIVRLLERQQQQVINDANVRGLLEAFASACGGALSSICARQVATRLGGLGQGLPSVLFARGQASTTVCGVIPEWGGLAHVRLDRLLLFRALDAMYGGDPMVRDSAPERPLTSLERSLAVRLASAVMGALQAALGEGLKATFTAPRCLDEADPKTQESAVAGGAEETCVLVRIDADAAVLGGSLAVLLPAKGLELLRGNLARSTSGEPRDIDPDWTGAFKRNVLAASAVLTALIDGPDMTLGDVARLKPGTLLEFDAKALAEVRLETADRAIFHGRLGQSKGLFTVLLERQGLAGPVMRGP